MSEIQTQLAIARPAGLELQLKEQRRSVDFDTFDIHLQQLLTSLTDGQIWVSPAYQRKFRWKEDRCSQLIESVLLGIPVPSMFMATNENGTWEVVDGLQRLSAIVKFAGDESLRKKIIIPSPNVVNNDELVLTDLKKLTKFNGLTYRELPQGIQTHFKTRPMKVITLNDKSETRVRYDLFERLNTGGVALSSQEIRDCVYQGKFANKLEELSKQPAFQTTLNLTPLQQRDGTAEECVLRFFAFLDRYKKFDHSVKDFLDDYMQASTKGFDYSAKEAIFNLTFSKLAKVFPTGISRYATSKFGRRGTTPLNLYEGVSVGAALAIRKTGDLIVNDLNKWMAATTLRDFTTGATNSRPAVAGRIEFCRDRFIGKPYVEPS